MKQRLDYIDAMRGLAMVMVVVSHCCYGSFNHNPIFNEIINQTLQIPLFFLISGFFVNKICKQAFTVAVVEKFCQLIVPVCLVLGIFCWIFHLNIVDVLLMNMKAGYWFTFILFGYIFIFLLVDLGCKKTRISDKKTGFLQILIALLIYILSCYAVAPSRIHGLLRLFSIPQFYGYVYFVIGAYLYKQREYVCNHLNNSILGGGILIYIFLQGLKCIYETDSLRYLDWLLDLVIPIIPIILIWLVFKANSEKIHQSNLGKFLILVGRRSLDVYFIHYFFLPKLHTWGEYFIQIDAPFIEYICAIMLAVPVIYASLGVGYVLRLSPLTARLFLGSCKK